MNRADLRRRVRRTLGCSALDAERSVEAVLAGIEDGVRCDGVVQILGFGTFRAKKRRPRQVRDLQHGGTLLLPVGLSVQFRSSRLLRGRAAEGPREG